MIFRELIQGGFGILMFQNCQVCEILPPEAFPILSICYTIQGLSTPIHPYTHSNLEQINKQHPDTP